MSDDNLQNQVKIQDQGQVQAPGQEEEPVYTFQGSTPAEHLLEIARIHNLEAKQLADHANESQAEDRQEEARLLADIARSRRETAEKFERVARGEGKDPIVSDILDWQKEISETYTPHSLTFTSKEDQAFVLVPEHMKPRPPGRIALSMEWIKRKTAWISHIVPE